ncbi:MAG: beta-lactamase family protein [Candidatus Hydrogenedentes bacterium]|nr:beta-lactamase family protein [Candidatus Hydrogenedentota bacterium]
MQSNLNRCVAVRGRPMTDPDAQFPTATAIIRGGYDQGLHTGAQVYVSRGGVALADFAVGHVRPETPMAPDTLMLWMSSCKPVGAVAIAQLCERGLIAFDTPVCGVIPEFAAGGKDTITVKHILTHTGGFRWAELGAAETSRDEIISRICAMPLETDWIPGQRAGYHIETSWFILGELVRRLDGRSYDRYVREAIFEPLGMNDSWIGMPPERYRGYGGRIGVMYNTFQGQCAPAGFDSETYCVSCRPGGGGRGPIRELGRFYEMLLEGGHYGGKQIVRSETVNTLTTRHRVGMMDETFRHRMDWGLGFILNSNRYGPQTVPYGYGLHASPRAFGHSGAQSSVGFADPEHGLVVAAVFNGMPGEPKHNRRMRQFLSALYVDLGLAPAPPTVP